MLYDEEIRALEIIIHTLETCPERTGTGDHCHCGGDRCGMSRGGYLLSEAESELRGLTERNIATRYPELAYVRHAANLWRLIDTETGQPIGPLYRSRSELLAGLSNFHKERFYLPPWRLED